MNENLKRNNPVQNAMAFSYLLTVGKMNILDDNFYNERIQEIDNRQNDSLMTPEFEKEVFKIARYMANMEEKELRHYIFERAKEEKREERGR